MISDPNQARWVVFFMACVALVLFWSLQRPPNVPAPPPTSVEIEIDSPARLSLDGVAQTGKRVGLPLDGKHHSLRISAKRCPLLLDP